MPAVSLNAQTVGVGSAATGFTTGSLTVAVGTNTELLLAITFSANISNLVSTWNLSQVLVAPTGGGGPFTGTNCGFTYFRHFTAPTTGLHTAVQTWTTSSDYHYCLIAYDNVAGGMKSATSVADSSGTASVSATNTANDGLFAFFQNIHSFAFNNVTIGTEALNDSSTSINGNSAYFIGPGANQTWTCTLTSADNWTASVITAANVVAATGCPNGLPLLGVGCSIAVPPIYPLLGGAAFKLGDAIRRNARLSRRAFLGRF